MPRLSHPLVFTAVAASGFLVLAGCTQDADDDDASETPGDDDTTAAPDDDTTAPPDDDDDATPLPESYRGLYVGLQLDGAGNPVAAYYDRDLSGVGIAVYKGGAWVRTAPPELGNPADGGSDSKDYGRYLSFLIAGGTWHLAFQDEGAEKAMYASSTDSGVTWTVVEADTQGHAGYFTALAVDGSGNPALCHYDDTQKNLRLAVRTGSAWAGAVVDEGTAGPPDAEGNPTDADVGRYCSVGSDGARWKVAYYDAANGDLKLADGSPGAFTVSTVDATGDTGGWPTLYKASTGWVIAYQAPGDQDLKLARSAKSGWSLETLDSADYVGADSSVAEIGGKLSIAYFDGVNNDVKLATDTGSGWHLRTVGSAAEETQFAGATGFSNNAVADATGKLHIASFRYDIGNFAYARTSP